MQPKKARAVILCAARGSLLPSCGYYTEEMFCFETILGGLFRIIFIIVTHLKKFIYVSVCMSRNVGTHVDGRGQLEGISSLLPSCGLGVGLKLRVSGLIVSLLTEPSQWSYSEP